MTIFTSPHPFPVYPLHPSVTNNLNSCCLYYNCPRGRGVCITAQNRGGGGGVTARCGGIGDDVLLFCLSVYFVTVFALICCAETAIYGFWCENGRKWAVMVKLIGISLSKAYFNAKSADFGRLGGVFPLFIKKAVGKAVANARYFFII